MNKLKTFFRTFWLSSTSPEYYRHVYKSGAGFSWKYFIVLNVFLSLLLSLFLIVPLMRVDVRMIANEFVQEYPQDLEIAVADGQLSINQPLPYYVAVPEKISEYGDIDTKPTNIATFTTDEDFGGVQNFDRFESLAVVTESAVYFMNDDDTGEIRAYLIPEIQEIKVDAAFVNNLKEQFLNFPFIKEKLYVPALVSLAFIVGMPAMLFARLLALVVYTFLIYIIARFFMNDKKFSYGKLYQVSMHSITPVIVVSWAAGYIADYSIHGIFHFGLFAVWTLYVLSQISVKKARPAAKRKAGGRKKKSK